MPTTERSSIEEPTLQRSPPTSRMGFASLVYPISMVWASSLVRTSNTADSSLLLPHNKSLDRSGDSPLDSSGAAWMDSRRRVNSDVRRKSLEVHMIQTEISGISPFFIVSHVPTSLAFYRDQLGFEITFQGPDPDDIFFGIVRRGGAKILLKDIGVDPGPYCTRDIKKGIARWDAFVYVPDPDALAAEFASRNVEFLRPLNDDEVKEDDDGLRGFEVKDADGYVLFFGRPRS